MQPEGMHLRIVTPLRIALDTPVRRIVAEGPDGAFGLLPRHVDFVSRIVPGILVYEDEAGREHYAGVHSGTLVKCAGLVRIAAQGAIIGEDLGTLQTRVREEFHALDEGEREARSALARLEAQMIRRFMDPELPL